MAETEQEERARYLVETYADQMLRLGYTLLGSVPDAQDVCQEVLLKALDRTQPFESRAHEKAWLLRVTVNACKNLRRSPWRTRTVSLEAVGEPAAFQPRAGGLLEEAGAVSLAGVSPTFRALFGITTEEQARQLGAAQLDLVFTDQNGSGAAITVREVVRDQEVAYVLLDFTAPAGTALPEGEAAPSGLTYWLGEEDGGFDAVFFADEACAQRVDLRSWSFGFQPVEDDDPADGTIPLLLEVGGDTALPEEAAWLRVTGLSSLWAMEDGRPAAVLEDMDFRLAVPLTSTAGIYAFDGRCGAALNGAAMATAEDLVLSPVAVTMDLVIPDGAAYDAAFDQYGPWELYVVLDDGTRVETTFQRGAGVQDVFHDDDGNTFFRADHVRFTFDSPIDPLAVADIVFARDNDRRGPGETVHFQFDPIHFQNQTYWSQAEGAA